MSFRRILVLHCRLPVKEPIYLDDPTAPSGEDIKIADIGITKIKYRFEQMKIANAPEAFA